MIGKRVAPGQRTEQELFVRMLTDGVNRPGVSLF